MALDAGPLRTPSFPGVSSPAATRRTAAPSERVRVRRVHDKASYAPDDVKAILDEALVAHLGFAHEGQPFVIPTLHARLGEEVYVHGSSASRTLRALGGALPACLTVTLLDGLVFARSVFEMSANYRSVVVLGDARAVTDPDEKLRALKAFSDQVMPGRWEDARQPTRQELKATAVLALPLDEASAKISTGGPDDGETEDAELPVWAGHVPLRLVAGEPVPCPHLRPGIAVPPEVAHYER
jgi:uncharacterized protein